MGHWFIWLSHLDTKKFGAIVFGEILMWCWRRIEKIKCSDKTNEEVVERIGEKRTFLNNTLCRKSQLDIRRNCLLHDVTEGQMPEVKRDVRKRT